MKFNIGEIVAVILLSIALGVAGYQVFPPVSIVWPCCFVGGVILARYKQ